MERIPKMSNTDIFEQLFTKLNHSKDQIFPSDNANFLLTFKPKKLRFTMNNTYTLNSDQNQSDWVEIIDYPFHHYFYTYTNNEKILGGEK